ncbi:MAG: tripartite tricarboxylate transporter substrate binding protein, partial [Pseudomonadota bacterium]
MIRSVLPLRAESVHDYRHTAGVGFALAGLLMAGAALAQPREFPQRPVRIVVPVPPGGSVDAVSRLLAPKMAESLGQPVLVDNRAGASTNIGMELVAR